MTPLPSGIGDVICKYVGKILGVPRFLARSMAAATLSLAQDFLEMSYLGETIGRIKESLLRKMEAEATAAEADAQEKIANAAIKANLAALHKRKDASARLEREKKEVQIAKTKAEAEAIRRDSETRRIQAIAQARTHFLEVVAKLRQEGGSMSVNPDNLNQIIDAGLPPEDDDDE